MIRQNDWKKKLFWTAVVILYVGFIFHNSFTPAIESSKQSGGVLEMVLKTTSLLKIKSGWITEHLIRKTAHFAEYLLFGILLGIAIRQYSLELKLRKVCQCWIGTMVPLTDETIQLFSEGRSGQVSDVWLDMSGVLTGFLLIGIWLWVSKKKTAGADRRKRN